jgi:hypothetical protein
LSNYKDAQTTQTVPFFFQKKKQKFMKIPQKIPNKTQYTSIHHPIRYTLHAVRYFPNDYKRLIDKLSNYGDFSAALTLAASAVTEFIEDIELRRTMQNMLEQAYLRLLTITKL